MKRSEMEKEIILFIDECINRDGFSLKETGEALLDFIEGCGMLPPCYLCENSNHGEYPQEESCYHNWEEK